MAKLSLANSLKEIEAIEKDLFYSYKPQKRPEKTSLLHLKYDFNGENIYPLKNENKNFIFMFNPCKTPICCIYDEKGNSFDVFKLSKIYYDFEKGQIVYDKALSRCNFIKIVTYYSDKKYQLSVFLKGKSFFGVETTISIWNLFCGSGIDGGFNSTFESLFFFNEKKHGSKDHIEIKAKDFMKMKVFKKRQDQ